MYVNCPVRSRGLSVRWLLFAAGALLLALVALQAASPVQASNAVNRPRVPLLQSTSSNWSGYSTLTNLSNPQAGSVSKVAGSWVVPTLNCATTPNGYSSTWVGIDGYSSATVEQLGTEQDCVRGTPVYSAWFEMYPLASSAIRKTVHAGDGMSASVTYIGSSRFQLQLSDSTAGWTYSTTQTSRSAARSSAEWVEEAPSSSGGTQLALADFQTAAFTGATATINGVTGPIDGASWQNDPITMLNGTASSTPGGVTDSAGGSTFSMTWSQTAPTPPPTPPPPPTSTTVHVGSISYTTSGGLSVSVVIDASSGQPVSGATVAIQLTDASNGESWTGSATTGSTGRVTFTLSRPPSGTYSTLVTSVTGNGLAWNGVTPPNSYKVSGSHRSYSYSSNGYNSNGEGQLDVTAS